jgi:hypothetical protein
LKNCSLTGLHGEIAENSREEWPGNVFRGEMVKVSNAPAHRFRFVAAVQEFFNRTDPEQPQIEQQEGAEN